MKKSIVKMNGMKFAIPLFVALAYGPAQGLAQPILDPALASFAVLGATGVTNVASSTIGGNLGSAPNASIGGGYVFTAGSLQPNTALAQQAQIDLDAAILAVNAGPGTSIGPVLTGTILPGIYDVGAAGTNIPGNLILDGGGSNTAVWRFRFSSTLIASEDSNVSVMNVGDGSGVGIYWTVGSAATLDGDTFAGNVLANQLISSNGGLTLSCGRLASAEGAVTLIMDTISGICFGTPGSGSGGFDQGNPTAPIPEPEIHAMMAVGLGLLGWVGRRKKLKEAAAA